MSRSTTGDLQVALRQQLPQTGPYFSLPRELRDMIMELVLHPGHIFIRVNAAPTAKHNFGNQFLATCRQAYDEGVEIYYGGNTFHFEPCSLSAIQQLVLRYERHLPTIYRLMVYRGIDGVSLKKLASEKGFVDWQERNFQTNEAIMWRSLSMMFSLLAEREWIKTIGWLHYAVQGHRGICAKAQSPTPKSEETPEIKFWGLAIELGSTDQNQIGVEEEKEVLGEATSQLEAQIYHSHMGLFGVEL